MGDLECKRVRWNKALTVETLLLATFPAKTLIPTTIESNITILKRGENIGALHRPAFKKRGGGASFDI